MSNSASPNGPRRPSKKVFVPKPRVPARRPQRQAQESGNGLVKGILGGAVVALVGFGAYHFLQKPAPKPVAKVVEAVKPVEKPVEKVAVKPTVVAEAPKVEVMEEVKKEVKVEAPVAAPVINFPEKLNLTRATAKNRDQIALRTAALDKAFATGDWAGYTALLQDSLQLEMGKSIRVGVTSTAKDALQNEAALEALLQHGFITSLGKQAKDLLAENSKTQKAGRWLLSNAPYIQSFMSCFSKADDLPKVMDCLSSILNAFPDASQKYAELAIACALVFDKPLQKESSDQQHVANVTGLQRFEWFRAMNEKGEMALPVDKQPAEDLVWVVCSTSSHEEMLWAHQKLHFKQRTWGEAYDKVAYRMDKATSGVKLYKEYTLEEVLKVGGVCEDRSYFSANSARAFGIPAAIVSGDGDRGPHAWICWKDSEKSWAFAGRYGGYPMGGVRDPESGRRIGEDVFIVKGDPKASQGNKVATARQLLVLADMYHDQPGYRGTAIDAAAQTAPKLPEAVEAQVHFWLDNRLTDSVTVWKDMLKGIKSNFAYNGDVMGLVKKAQEKAVFPRQTAAQNEEDLKRDAKEATKEGSEGAGTNVQLIVSTIQRTAQESAQHNDFTAVHALYRKALKEHGQNSLFFLKLAPNYYDICKPQPKEVGSCCTSIENAAEKEVGLDPGDYFAAKKKLECWQLVRKFWLELGETKKADKITKVVEIMEKAVDSAK